MDYFNTSYSKKKTHKTHKKLKNNTKKKSRSRFRSKNFSGKRYIKSINYNHKKSYVFKKNTCRRHFLETQFKFI
jgi:hypothetical protein